MRLRATIGALIVASTAIGTTGCDQAAVDKAVEQFGKQLGAALAEGFEEAAREMLRDRLLNECGPVIISSIVGSCAPPGGPPPLSLLCADAGWRMALVGSQADMKRVPSVLDSPNPNVQLQHDGRPK